MTDEQVEVGGFTAGAVWQAKASFEQAIRADERQRLAALCAWCGKERPTDGYADDALCFGLDGKSEPHAFETTASALGRLKRYEEALREADRLLEGMWSFSEEGRAGLVHTWFVRASDVLRAALAEPQGGGE